MERVWLKGDTHLHTINSDGVLTKGQLVDACKEKGLDFMIITDHNFNSVEESYFDGDMLIIQGQEITGEPGHVNVWGKKVPLEPPYSLDNQEDYTAILDECKKAGGVISVNHPYCTNCGYHLNLEDYPFDCVEVWNAIQHTDNMKNRDWWVNQLLKGNKIAAVGGSDYHKNYVGVNILAMPTTIVNAKEKTADAVLKAIVEGRSVITNSPNSSMIYLSCGDATIGDTIKLEQCQKLELKATDLRKGHTIKVFNNEKVIFEQKIAKNSPMLLTTIDIEEKGFVRCEITYEFSSVTKKLYTFAENKVLKEPAGPVPEFIWALTNPIWVE